MAALTAQTAAVANIDLIVLKLLLLKLVKLTTEMTLTYRWWWKHNLLDVYTKAAGQDADSTTAVTETTGIWYGSYKQ